MSKLSSLAWAALVLIILAACQSPAAREPELPSTVEDVPRITVKQLKELLAEGRGLMIVDTRSREAFEELHLPAALYLDDFEARLRSSPSPKDTKIVLYCS